MVADISADIILNSQYSLVSKPRMVRSDSWKIGKFNKTKNPKDIRPSVLKYLEFKDYLLSVCISQRLKKIEGQVLLGFVLKANYLNMNQDIDNIIKCILDCLNGVLWENDCLKYIRGYKFVNVDYVCDTCDCRELYTRGKNKGKRKPHCGKGKDCKKVGFTMFIWRVHHVENKEKENQ